jgi:hypothetical protein
MTANPLGRILEILGIAIVVVGVAFLFFEKIPFLGKLPGDIAIRRKNFTFILPVATSLLLSLMITAIIDIISIFRK